MKLERSKGRDRLIMFGRYPIPGRTKTRLMPAMGAFNAADVQRRLTEMTFRTVRNAAIQNRVEIQVCFNGGDERRMRRWLGGNALFARQGSGDLGIRMRRAFADAFRAGCRRVVLVGTDVPTLRVRHLEAALAVLGEKDLVLGPSTDGGYWLIGMKRPADVYRKVSWGTSEVLAQTLVLARGRGLSVGLLGSETDVDTIDDLRNWRPEEAEPRPYLSVIIPALNEEANIGTAIESAVREEAEVIVVDGGSRDRTAARAIAAAARLIRSPVGRAIQQNRGAEAARGRVFLFLHADTVLPKGYMDHVFETLMDGRPAVGAFRFKTDIDLPWMRVIERAVNIRSKYLGLPYGDQGLFVRKETFRREGGFPEVPVAEDLFFVRRLMKRGRVAIAPAAAVTSGRRWEKLGLFRTTLINAIIAVGCLAGISAHRLASLYGIAPGRRFWGGAANQRIDNGANGDQIIK
ncbi:MAG: TIGR04283 family arsenosugar biosynthesis glycosyltransferase [Deltaproteobacteria bacterium]|nr:TIGR04283 family arsenosugar biosynthesis glycosyltransferase [Deltaproteobacteria bacterium]